MVVITISTMDFIWWNISDARSFNHIYATNSDFRLFNIIIQAQMGWSSGPALAY